LLFVGYDAQTIEEADAGMAAAAGVAVQPLVPDAVATESAVAAKINAEERVGECHEAGFEVGDAGKFTN
jgi:hypothetical protein